MQVLSWEQPQGSTTCLETTHASDPFPLVRHGAPSTTGHLGMSQCPNLGTSLQGAGAERTCLISAIRGDTCASFQHITAYTCCHGPAPCGAVVKEAQNRDPGKNWELNPLFDKICSFCFPPLFSLAIVLLQELRTKKRPMSQNKGFPWIPQQNFLKVHILGRKFPVRFDLPRSKALSLIGKLRKPARWRNEVKPIHPLLWCYQLKVIYWIYW